MNWQPNTSRKANEVLEKVTAYFPLIHGPDRKPCIQQFFVEELLPSNVKEIHRQISSIVTRICCRGNVFTEPLPSNERGEYVLPSLCLATIGAIHVQTPG
jgi:hypothetical protein